ncbi:hypothetical protein OsJ_06738 [Oryza sativa Japonica Group]|uniref:Uncharacterized protein n=1 Tax=Oryza sativa subsp. japonica TaxID=39947 RepID=B9F004_ORYSJ|nr:hypothetical protein OsJ_06738 [Oryza sativa Japonica Group]
MDNILGGSTQSCTKTGPLADITNISGSGLTNRRGRGGNKSLSASPTSSNGSHEDVSDLTVAELKRKRARDRYAALTPQQKDDRNKKARERRKRKKEETQEETQASEREASHLNITPRRLPFTIINNVAHYGPNEVPMSRVTQLTTLNMNSADFTVHNSGCENHYDPIVTSGNQNTHSPMHESGIFQGNDRNECDHDDDISLARRDKPCAESIALECPEGSSPSLLNPKPCLEATGDVPSTSSLQTEHSTYHRTRSCTFDDDDMDSFMDDDSDDEYYMFVGLGDDEDDDMVQSDDDDTQSPTSSVPDPFDYVYSNIPQSTNVLKPEPDCKHCGAKRFQYEPPSFCCRDGKINLVQNETPPELMRLWTSSDPDAKHFRDNIRYFNGHFSFTTLGVSLDKAFANMSSGVYTFRAHGQICHNIHSFSPRDSGPEHLELYFYDDDPTLSHRFQHSPSLDQDVIRTVADVLRNNPYSETFRSLGQAEDLANYRVTLNLDHRLDQRRYNVPVAIEVAAV